MYAISLTSIPPRFDRLGPVLESLLAQRPAPERIVLALPARFARFPGPYDTPRLPRGIEPLVTARDEGPATKVLPAAHALAGSGLSLIYCDDDWLMPAGWAKQLLEARAPGEAVAAGGFDVNRLKRVSHRAPDPDYTDIAQGYGGVLVQPGWFASADCAPPPEAWPVDDIWLSAMLARQGIPVRLARAARRGQALAFEDAHTLQAAMIGGRTRHAANQACAALVHRRYGLWPPRDG